MYGCPPAGRLHVGSAFAPRLRVEREAIPATRHRDDRTLAEQFAQRMHLHGQVVVLDDAAFPDQVVQLGTRDHPIASLDQSEQEIERAAAQRRWLAVDQHLPLYRPDLHVPESVLDFVNHQLGEINALEFAKLRCSQRAVAMAGAISVSIPGFLVVLVAVGEAKFETEEM